jgi:hypothetical protein
MAFQAGFYFLMPGLFIIPTHICCAYCSAMNTAGIMGDFRCADLIHPVCLEDIRDGLQAIRNRIQRFAKNHQPKQR